MPRLRKGQVRDPAPSAGAEDLASVSPGLSLARSYEDLPASAFCIAWSADGAFLAASGGRGGMEGSGIIAVWSAASGQRYVLPQDAQASSVIGLAWHPDRPVLASAGVAGQIHVWDVSLSGPSESFSLNLRLAGDTREVRGLV